MALKDGAESSSNTSAATSAVRGIGQTGGCGTTSNSNSNAAGISNKTSADVGTSFATQSQLLQSIAAVTVNDTVDAEEEEERRQRQQQEEMATADTERELAEDAQWKRIQQNTFTRWANEHLKTVNKHIGNLETDLSDGLRLIDPFS